MIRTIGTGDLEQQWTASHLPAANTQATCTRAAGAGKRNVCTSITVGLAGGAIAPSAVNVDVVLLDGASGSSTVLWAWTTALPAVAGASSGLVELPLFIVGSVNTPLTLEWTAAGGANTKESVTMQGTVI